MAITVNILFKANNGITYFTQEWPQRINKTKVLIKTINFHLNFLIIKIYLLDKNFTIFSECPPIDGQLLNLIDL